MTRNKKRFTALILCLFLTGQLLSGCGKETLKAYYFTVCAKAGSFDPQICNDTTARLIVRNTFEGLVRMDENGNYSSAVANRYTVSPDGLVYTFYLTKGIKWHITSNAQEALKDKLPENFAPEVTANDFAFALKRTLNPAMNAPDAQVLFSVKGARDYHNDITDESQLGIAVLDTYTLQITLEAPFCDFLEVLTLPCAMPCNETFFNACGGRYGLYIKYSLSNGPFYLSRFDDSSYRLAKNPDYTGNYPALSDVIWLYAVDEDTAVQGIKEGKYNGGFLSSQALNSLDNTPKGVSVTDTVYGFLLNENDEILANEKIRRAFALSADYLSFVAQTGNTYAPTIYPASTGINTGYQQSKADIKTAVELINEGLSEEGLTQTDITLLCQPIYENALKQLLQSWQKNLGITFNITLSPVSASELASAVANGDYQIALYPIQADMRSPYSILKHFYKADTSEKTENETIGAQASEDTDTKLVQTDTDSALDTLFAVFNANENDLSALIQAENEILARYTYIPLWQQSTYFVSDKATGALLLPGEDALYLHGIQ